MDPRETATRYWLVSGYLILVILLAVLVSR